MQDMNTGMGLDKLTQTGVGATQVDPSMYEQRRNQIAAMPPGAQKEAALAALLRDYQGQTAAAENDMARGQGMADTPMAQGQQLGGRYSTYVASSPLEHLATGLRQYQGNKQAKTAKEKLEELSTQQQQAREGLFRSGLGGGTKFGMYDRTI